MRSICRSWAQSWMRKCVVCWRRIPASITQCAVLSALDYLDECKKAETSSENLRSQIQDYLEDAARARTDSEISKRELERMGKELAALRAKSAQ